MSLIDTVTYFYIKNIKRWMFCPVCNQKMHFSKTSKSWSCNSCNYSLLESEFLDDFVFWFCDGCETYLNIQKSFNRKAESHICEKCGFNNDTTFSNIKGQCKDCGKLLNNPDATICQDCKTKRIEKARDFCLKAASICEELSSTLNKKEETKEGDNEMGFFSDLLGSFAKDFSDGATCPICNNKCYWDNDECTWICESCGYEVESSQVEYDKENDKVNVLGIDWYCDECDAYLNSQSGFDPYDDSWTCSKCGYENSLTKDDVL